MPSRSKIPTRITKAGWLLIGAALLIGATAYNSANNVLFLALSFLLSLILLNGILSWWNFSKLTFSPLQATETRAEQPSNVSFSITNNKRIIPSLGFLAHMEISSSRTNEEAVQIPITQSINPSDHATIQTTWSPSSRGQFSVRLSALTSLFPFGFILKTYRLKIEKQLTVWPQRVDYNQELSRSISARESGHLSQLAQSTGEGEVSGIRQYTEGDSMRTLHWKKTASMGKPISKTLSAEQTVVTQIRFSFLESLFKNETELDFYCAAIGSWTEDLLKRNSQIIVQLHNSQPLSLTKIQDWRKLMDELAVIKTDKQSLIFDSPQVNKGSVVNPQQLKTK